MSSAIAWMKSHPWQITSIVLAVALVVVSGLLIAGGGDDGSQAEIPTAESSTTTTSIDPGGNTTPSSTAPGQTTTTIGDVEIIEGVTAVVIDNVSGVGPQIGLNAADLLIETPVEGGITRFTALYGTEVPSLIGPVRSLRPVSADLLAPFSPIVFTTGGQPFVLGSVASVATIITPEDSIAFQSLERPRPHHVFVTPGEDVPSGVEVVPPWEIGPWAGGEAAVEIGLPLDGGITWVYEDDSYVRYRGGEPQEVLAEFDGELEPIRRETLVILMANQKSAGYRDSNGVDVPTFDVVGSGELYVLHAGEVERGTWVRPDQSSPYTFTRDDGALLTIPGGKAYLAVIPKGDEVPIG